MKFSWAILEMRGFQNKCKKLHNPPSGNSGWSRQQNSVNITYGWHVNKCKTATTKEVKMIRKHELPLEGNKFLKAP